MGGVGEGGAGGEGGERHCLYFWVSGYAHLHADESVRTKIWTQHTPYTHRGARAHTHTTHNIHTGLQGACARIHTYNTHHIHTGLHCRIVGRPGRALGLAKFMDYVKAKEKTWVCRRIDICNHWYLNPSPKPST
jgi:peptidoglycan/xylan/chitin deacetylase (PgdA/CDA1 family)